MRAIFARKNGGINMQEMIFEFMIWLSQNYGRAELILMFLATLVLVAIGAYELSRLSESKEMIIPSKCVSCKYERTDRKPVTVLACSRYKEKPLFQLQKPLCPVGRIETDSTSAPQAEDKV